MLNTRFSEVASSSGVSSSNVIDPSHNSFAQGFISAEFGFVPVEPPLLLLPPEIAKLDEIAAALPLWVREKNIEAFRTVEGTLDFPALQTKLATLNDKALARVNVILSALMHAYGYLCQLAGQASEADRDLPKLFSLWEEAYSRAGRGAMPILTINDSALNNWKYKDKNMPHTLDNMLDIRNLDVLVPVFESYEELVSTVGFVVLEAYFAKAIVPMQILIAAISAGDVSTASAQLDELLQVLQEFKKAFLKLFNLQKGSDNYIDLEVWSGTFIKFNRRAYSKEANLSGFDIPMMHLIENVFSYVDYDTDLHHDFQEKFTMLPSNHAAFIKAVRQANVRKWIEGSNSVLLKHKFNMLYEAYVGKHGFLGVHRNIAANLAIVGAEVRSESNMGFKISADLGAMLDASRQKRRLDDVQNNVVFTIKGIEKISEDGASGDTYAVTLLFAGDHGRDQMAKLFLPGTTLEVPIKNSAEAVKTALGKLNKDPNMEVDLSQNSSWNAALRRWNIEAKSLTLKVLLQYADLTHCDSPVFDVTSIQPAPVRTYSVSGVTDSGVRLLVKRQVYANGARGQGSHYLTDESQIGQQFVCGILPPVRFALPNPSSKPILLFANGNGVSPYLYFLDKLAIEKSVAPITLVLFTRDMDLQWLEMNLQSALKNLNLTVHFVQTGQVKKIHKLTSGATTEIAYSNEARQQILQENVMAVSQLETEYFIYVCGGTLFSKSILEKLEALLGKEEISRLISANNVVYEAFSFTDPALESEAMAAKKTFTSEEINQHGTKDSCWVKANRRVYDITAFLNLHPGGSDLFTSKALANRDISELYKLVHAASPAAQSWLNSYYIGEQVDPAVSALLTEEQARSFRAAHPGLSTPTSAQQLCPFAALFKPVSASAVVDQLVMSSNRSTIDSEESKEDAGFKASV